MTKLRAALVGLGIMGANHARVLSNLDGVDLVAVADPQGDTRGMLPGTEVLTSVDEVIKKNVDYCVIAAPTAFHEEISLKLIDAGIHILIEKPIAHTLESAKRITKAASEKGVIGAVGHIERFNSALQQARTRIQNGDLGEIFQISTRRLGPFPARIADVGVVMDLATHDIDLTSWIADSEYLNISAQSATRSGRAHEDLVAVVAQLKNGNGTVNVSQQQIAHFKGVSQGDIQIYAFNKPEPLALEHQNFRDAVLGIESEIVTLQAGTKTVEVAESIIRSTLEQKAMNL